MNSTLDLDRLEEEDSKDSTQCSATSAQPRGESPRPCPNTTWNLEFEDSEFVVDIRMVPEWGSSLLVEKFRSNVVENDINLELDSEFELVVR